MHKPNVIVKATILFSYICMLLQLLMPYACGAANCLINQAVVVIISAE